MVWRIGCEGRWESLAPTQSSTHPHDFIRESVTRYPPWRWYWKRVVVEFEEVVGEIWVIALEGQLGICRGYGAGC